MPALVDSAIAASAQPTACHVLQNESLENYSHGWNQSGGIYGRHLVNCKLHAKHLVGGFTDFFDKLFTTAEYKPFIYKRNSEHAIRILQGLREL
jgi:hypothetical protein